MKFLYPTIPLRQLPIMLEVAAIGAATAGLYGAVHDQISYAISPEYFTKLKFEQFAYADFELPPMAFVSLIGFLATWWVGLLGGWILARLGLAAMPHSVRRRQTAKAFTMVVLVTALMGAAGALVGKVRAGGDLQSWHEAQLYLEIVDLKAFVMVAYLHAAGYLGAAVGIVLAAVYVSRTSRR